MSANLTSRSKIQPLFAGRDYGAVCGELLAASRPMELVPTRPQESGRDLLRRLSAARLVDGKALIDDSAAQCCLAGLWLRFDYLDESHTISQQIETVEGSYWHAIMHRREPDFSNSKYWYRRVGRHPVYSALSAAASGLVATASRRPEPVAWAPCEFVDACERQHRSPHSASPTALSECQEIAEWEWWLLFDYCYGLAIGRSAMET